MEEETKQALNNLREHFETVIKASDSRHEQAVETLREAIAMSRDGNNRRFDQMSEFRNAITDQVNRMIPRPEFDTARESANDKAEEARRTVDARFDSELKPINARLDQIGRPNWALMASMMSIFLVLVGGVWLVIGLKIEAMVNPVAIDLAQMRSQTSLEAERLRQLELLTSNSVAADAQSRVDRGQLNERVRGMEATIASNAGERRGQITTIQAKLIEIETQFCASDIIRNLINTHDMRLFSLLWRKAFGPDTKLPTDNSYFPKICNREGTQE